MKLDRVSSHAIVSELLRVLGEENVVGLLGINTKRLNALTAGRGCLDDAQLKRISHQTKRSWMRWGVDSTVGQAKTPKARELVAATYELLDRIDPQPRKVASVKSRPKSLAQQPKVGSFRQAV